MARYAVIGLGRFGMSVAQKLALEGAEVLAIDLDIARVEEAQNIVSLAVRMDATDEAALSAQEVSQVDCAIVAIGADFEANALVTVLLKQIGVKRVIARSTSPIRGRILHLIGADEIVSPEEDSAEVLAKRLLHPSVVDYIELSEGHKLVQVKAPKTFHFRSLMDLDLRKKYEVTLIAIKRKTTEVNKQGEKVEVERVNDLPGPYDVIEPEDILFLVGTDENIDHLLSE